MKKRLLTIVLALAATLCLCFGISACGKVIYKLNFIVDDEVYATIDTSGEEAITMPNNPTKENYIFDGWYWDKDIWQRPFTADSLLHEKLTSDMSVYAKWLEEDITKRSYTVTFNSMSGSAVEEAKVVYGHLLTEPAKPTRTGYVFVGWYKEADLSTKWDFAADTVTKDTTLYAKWVAESDATGCEILTAEGFTASNNTLSVKVSNAQEYFALSAAITVSPYATWTVSSDIGGSIVIPSATVSLNVGDNTYYINVTSGNGSNKKQYAVNIRRREVYTVTYEPNNGDADIVEQVEEDQKLENKQIEKTGYSFTEWLYRDTPWDFEQGISGNMTLTATWQANSYQVTFDSKEGSTVEETTVTYDAEFEFEVPTRKGYTFNGWKTEDNTFLTDNEGKGKDVWKIADDTEVTADWTVVEYKITYHNAEGATNTNKIVYTVEDEKITLSDATKAGYTFLGWFDAQNDGTKVTEIDTSQAENVNLWARWQTIEYTATFKADENEQQVTFTVEDETLDEPKVPEKHGYTGVWEDYEIEPHDLTIEAVYTPIEYTIHYLETKDAANPNPETYNIEDETITLKPIEKAGYTFDGWFEDDAAASPITQGSTGERTFTAHWTVIEYDLHLEYEEEIGGYREGESNPVHFTVESEFELKSLVIKTEGYTFLGWFTQKNDGEGEKVDAIRPGRTENLTLYAHWGLEVYTITYHNVDGVVNTNATNYTIKSEPIEIKELSKLGYTFDGWFSDNDLQQEADTTIETGSHGNLDFYAKWSLVNYHITYTLYDGHYENGESNPETYTIETDLQLKNPVKDGYIFDGWYDQADGGNKITEIKGMTGPLSLYARWIHISTITFDTRDGSPIEPIKQAAGSDVSAPTETPTKDYYTFAGWYEDENCETEYHFSKMPETDITVYAKWTPIEYQIIYDLDGGDNSKDNPATYNYESSFELQDPTKVGHSFIGWFTSNSYTEQIERIEKGRHGDLHLYARFQVNQYTITFNSNEGTSVESITQNYGTKVDAPANPSKNGYKFAGWYTEQMLRNKYTFSTMPADNITLWAKWERVEYDIHYHLENGVNAPENPLTYNIESETITLQEPSRLGYKFIGWYSDVTCETEIKTIDEGSFGEKEIYAKWEIISYDITYVFPDGATHNNPTSYTVETALTALEAATLKGHHFDGWFTEDEYLHEATQFGDGEIGEKTFYAKFTPNTYTVWLDGTDEATATVTFDPHGAPASVTMPSAQHISETDSLQYQLPGDWSGHLFAGWYANADCNGSPYDFTDMVGGNLVLYAKWIDLEGANAIKINTSVSVTLQGKTELVYRFVPLVSGNVTIATTGNIDTLGSLYCDGKLLKMNDDSGSSAGTGNNFLIVYNVTAGEVYEIRVRAFSASASGTTSLSLTGTATPQAGGHTQTGNRTQITYGDDTFTLPKPTRGELDKFLGWMDAEGTLYTDSEGRAVKAWDKDETTVLFSKWERMEYTVTFVTSGGSDVTNTASNQVTLEYGARLDVNLYTTTCAGKTFLGWFESLAADEPYDASTMPDHAITLYAKWANYGLGEIKYDEDKKAISVYDELNADLFGAICLDTDGKPATITVTISGEQTAGQTVSIVLVAQNGSATPKRKTITNVKVYGAPTVSVSEEDRGYVNLSEKIGEWNGEIELENTLFGGSGTDTFDAATTIRVTVEGTFEAGETVTITIHSIDPAGNDTTKEIENVKVYGEPVITYDEEKLEVRESDELSAALFSATAKDSFDEDVTVQVALQSGTKTAGNTITVRLTATDTKGNTKTIDIEVKVYGTPTISEPSTTDFKVEDDINVESLGLTAHDTYNELLEITLSHTGEQKAGETMTFTATVTDAAGNTQTKEIQVKIYGTPAITVGRMAVKDSETVDASVLKATAKDSFGQELEVTVTLASGTFAGGQTVTYTLTATDKVGNACTREDVSVKVYAQSDIQLTYQGGASQVVKLTSRGEEFSASATDSFGEACKITLEAAEGFTLKGGQIVSLYIVATDAAGNIKKSELISGIKVYAMPTIVLNDEYRGYVIKENENISFAFRVYDSFGEELYFETTADAEQIGGTFVNYTINAIDDAGNVISETFTFAVIKNQNMSFVELYVDDELFGTRFVDENETGAIIEIVGVDGYKIYTWNSSDGVAIIDYYGRLLVNLPKYIKLYADVYEVISNADDLANIKSSQNYVLDSDIDLGGTEWKPISFSGKFDGRGYKISNFKITNVECAGLFSTNNGQIRNLGVADFSIVTNLEVTVYAGGVAGRNNGTISNCYAEGVSVRININDSRSSFRVDSITAAYVGGLVGYNNGSISSCYSNVITLSGKVSTTGGYDAKSCVGGLVGYNSGCIITSYSTSNVDASASDSSVAYSFAGGLVGFSVGTIEYCFATGDVASTVKNLSNTENSNTRLYSYAGGLVGYSTVNIIATYRKSTQAVSSLKYSFSTSTSAMQGFTTSTGTSTTLENLQSKEWLVNNIFINEENIWRFSQNQYPIFYWSSGMTLSATEITKIVTKEDLLKLKGQVLTGVYILEDDINLNGSNWEPMVLEGVFYGNNHIIRNFSLTSACFVSLGLFSYNSGIIKDLGIEDFRINTTTCNATVYAGGLVGHNLGSIIRCHAVGSLNISVKVTETRKYSDIKWYSLAAYAGGLVGNNSNGSVSYSYAAVNVTVTSNDANADINSYYSGACSYTVEAGGLVAYGGNINNCYTIGNVSATCNRSDSSRYLSLNQFSAISGGISAGSSLIINSYATGDVTATAYNKDDSYASGAHVEAYAGGLIGRGGSVSNSFATGKVTASATSLTMYPDNVYVAGYVGYIAGFGATVENSYRASTQTISATGADRTTWNTSVTSATIEELFTPDIVFGAMNWSEEIWLLEENTLTLK